MTRLLFVVTEDWYFVSHRLHLAQAAAAQGYRVAVLTRISSYRERIEQAGIEIIDWPVERRSGNPLREAATLYRTWLAMRMFKPDIVHAVALKPVIYAWIAAVLAGVRGRVYALGGLGHVFASESRTAALIRPAVVAAFRRAFAGKRTRLILQNPDDRALLLRLKVVDPSTVRLIRGAGVDTAEFACYPEPEGMPLVVLPGRMLWDKGVAEFVRAARCVRQTGVQARFALVGASDPQNPACVPPEQLAAWQDEGVVECWGRRDDMPAVLRSCAVVCLPSYREGLPKALLEAASSGRAIVTYDVPGCREVVTDGVNGILVAPRDEPALHAALIRLLADRGLRGRMGGMGRARVMKEFSQERVAAETMAVWREVAANDGESR